MTWSDVRDTVVSYLEGVDGISGNKGKVLKSLPDYTKDSDIQNAMVDAGEGVKRLNLWIVTRGQARMQRGGGGSRIPIGMTNKYHSFNILGLYSFTGDDSEDAFQDIIENILTTFTTTLSLGHHKDGWLCHEPNANHIEPANFGPYLTHQVSIQLLVEEQLQKLNFTE